MPATHTYTFSYPAYIIHIPFLAMTSFFREWKSVEIRAAIKTANHFSEKNTCFISFHSYTITTLNWSTNPHRAVIMPRTPLKTAKRRGTAASRSKAALNEASPLTNLQSALLPVLVDVNAEWDARENGGRGRVPKFRTFSVPELSPPTWPRIL
jgi:hypothetical protein